MWKIVIIILIMKSINDEKHNVKQNNENDNM